MIVSCKNTSEEHPVNTEELTNIFNVGSLNSDAPKELIQFGQLVGEWNCISKDLVDSVWVENKATWNWQYILDGHAIQDFWWQENNAPTATYKSFKGTNVRSYNLATEQWEIAWVDNRTYAIAANYKAVYSDGKILMDDGSGTFIITFYDIKENTFEWKFELINPDGSLKVTNYISATRK